MVELLGLTDPTTISVLSKPTVTAPRNHRNYRVKISILLLYAEGKEKV